MQEIVSRLGLPDGSITHYGLNGDVNNVLMMADIVLYGSSQEIQSFPPLLIRAMSFGIPIMVPDLPGLRNYVSLFEICCQDATAQLPPPPSFSFSLCYFLSHAYSLVLRLLMVSMGLSFQNIILMLY